MKTFEFTIQLRNGTYRTLQTEVDDLLGEHIEDYFEIVTFSVRTPQQTEEARVYHARFTPPIWEERGFRTYEDMAKHDEAIDRGVDVGD